MTKHLLMVLVILISLSFLFSVSAADLNNSTSDLTQDNSDFQNLTNTMEPDREKSESGISTDYFQNNNISNKDDSTVYIILDNDADKENVYLGDYVTWIVSVYNLNGNTAKC